MTIYQEPMKKEERRKDRRQSNFFLRLSTIIVVLNKNGRFFLLKLNYSKNTCLNLNQSDYN